MSSIEMDSLRSSIAEIIGSDPVSWPSHGNAPLAIASVVALDQQRIRVLQERLTTAEQLLHSASIKLATWIDCKESPRAEIIEFLGANHEQ